MKQKKPSLVVQSLDHPLESLYSMLAFGNLERGKETHFPLTFGILADTAAVFDLDLPVDVSLGYHFVMNTLHPRQSMKPTAEQSFGDGRP